MAMTTDERGFINAIIAEPESDAPRLVYADWLRENRQEERAEFIQVQCRIAVLEKSCLCGSCVGKRGGGQHHNGPCAVDREREELPGGRSRQAFLRDRTRRLLYPVERGITNAELWGGLLMPSGSEYIFRRGFIESISCPLAAWLQHGPKLVRECPLTAVRLSDREPVEGSQDGAWYWFLNIDGTGGASLPASLFYRLKNQPPYTVTRSYRSPDIAHADLSAACLAWARAEPVRE